MYRAAALLYPDALATSVTLPMEIMRAASQMARAGRSAARVDFLLAADPPLPLSLASGLTLTPDLSPDALPLPDLLVLPAIWRNPRPTLETVRPRFGWLREMAAAGTRICSVGTASWLLAEAGLLDGRPATTHWNFFESFRRRYPQVHLKTRHLITQSDNIYCAGSVNSIADLMVHVLEEWFGSRIAQAVEQQFSPEIRRSFSSAAYQNEPLSGHHDETVLEAQQWLQQRLPGPVSLARLAARFGLSPRSLTRRFRQAIGMTPQAYLQSLRVAAARDLLRHSNLPVSDIAWQVGLQDASYFSSLFRRHTGMTPRRYREAVRGKLFQPERAVEGA